ncbi:MAG: transglutaminase domain-containing protein [bacterium]
MKILFYLTLFSLLLMVNLSCSSSTPSLSPQAESIQSQLNYQFEDQDEWLGMYIAGNKVGYAVFALDTLNNGILQERELMVMKLTAGSKGLEITTRGVSYGNQQGYVDSFFYEIKSETQTLHLKGIYQTDSLQLTMISDNHVEQKIFAAPPLPLTMIDAIRFFGDQQQITLEIFEPSTQEVVEIVIEDLGVDTSYQYGVLRHYQATMLGVPIDIWFDQNNRLIKQEMQAMQMVLKSEPRELAEDLSLTELSPDIYKQFKVDTDRPLENPRNLVELTVIINHLDIDIACFNQKQKGDTVFVTSADLEWINSELPDSVLKYVEPSPLIQSQHPDIVNAAENIIGSERNLKKQVELLNHWVYQNLQKEPTFTVPSALDILNTRQGDCNEHSTLLCALLRAIGIPARIAVGIVHANNDGFYYHAWCEVYLGKWFSIDPTMDQIPSDASHIAISRGNTVEQAKIMTVMGKIDIIILNTKYK